LTSPGTSLTASDGPASGRDTADEDGPPGDATPVVGYVVLVPEELSVARVGVRAEIGGHDVPEDKIRSRYQRLWDLVRAAIAIADETYVYDNSRAAEPFRLVARFSAGRLEGRAEWPAWAPESLTASSA